MHHVCQFFKTAVAARCNRRAVGKGARFLPTASGELAFDGLVIQCLQEKEHGVLLCVC